MKHVVAPSFTVAALLVAGVTSADGPAFGARAQTVLVLDNLAGIGREVYSVDRDSGDGTALTSGGTGRGFYSYGTVTRFGVHRFIGDTVSLGTGIHYADRTAGNLEVLGQVGATIVTLSPRLGFAAPLSPSSAFWFRMGMTYHHVSYDHDAGHSHDVLVGGEIYYVYTPVEHFGITIGPTLEVGVEGSAAGSSLRTTATRRTLYGLGFGFLFDL